MEQIERLKIRLQQVDEELGDPLLIELLESAKAAILAKRFPFGNLPTELESRYFDLQIRIAMDLYNKIGAEGEMSHSENGTSRSYQSSWISEDLLNEITPMCGIL